MEGDRNVTMAGCPIWPVLFICYLASFVAGELKKPLNVTIKSRNFSLFLTWLPAPENPPFVTYEVQYTNYSDHDDDNVYTWTPVPECENISMTECDITCVIMGHWDWDIKVRVRTIYPSTSLWVESQDIFYMFAVDPDPPNLNVTQGNGSITIEAITQKPACAPEIIFKRILSYSVLIEGKNQPKEQMSIEQEMDGNSITLKTLGYNGEYCVAAKTKLTFSIVKESKFSNPVCLDFTKKDGNSYIILAVLISCCAILIIVLIFYKTTVKFEKPAALDFSNNKYWQKNVCLPEMYSEVYHQVTIYCMTEQDSSNKSHNGIIVYPVAGQAYMERPTMQTSDSHSQKYVSSEGFDSSSDKTSTGCTCSNTSVTTTDLLFRAKIDQTNDSTEENNISVPEEVEMVSLTPSSMNLFDSFLQLDPNPLVNVPLNTLCIGDIDEHMDISDEESGNQCLTDPEDDLDALSLDLTDTKMSDSESLSQDETNKKSSDYTQRTYMSRR